MNEGLITPDVQPADKVGRILGLTESAARRIAVIVAEQDAAGSMLRVSVNGGGCQGYRYSFTLDDSTTPDDVVFENHGAKLVVDDVSLDLLAGGQIDFKEELGASYFAVKNPNAKSSCGCGTSFST